MRDRLVPAMQSDGVGRQPGDPSGLTVKCGPSRQAAIRMSAFPLGYWLLQDAKARFSELVRKVRSEGPQHVTVHGRDEVVVIAADEFRRLTGNVTGLALIEAMQASPYREVELEPGRGPMPVRDVSL